MKLPLWADWLLYIGSPYTPYLSIMFSNWLIADSYVFILWTSLFKIILPDLEQGFKARAGLAFSRVFLKSSIDKTI